MRFRKGHFQSSIRTESLVSLSESLNGPFKGHYVNTFFKLNESKLFCRMISILVLLMRCVNKDLYRIPNSDKSLGVFMLLLSSLDMVNS